MTNKEILQADMLDILFENRNKQYGAYALRREYDNRMLKAMGITGLVILVFIVCSAFKTRQAGGEEDMEKADVVVKHIELPRNEQPEEPRKPDPPKQKLQRTEKFTQQILLVKEKTDSFPRQEDIQNGNVGTEKTPGDEPDGRFAKEEGKGKPGGEKQPEPQKEDKPQDFKPQQRDARFPGGKEAFRDFLSRYLQTPGDLEPGEKKVVVVRIRVGADGQLSDMQVIESAGDEYSREVLRVLKKMPPWEPAMQNGVNVPVHFIQPVTFVGQEE